MSGCGDERPEVGLCAGKDCRKRAEFASLKSELESNCQLVLLPCVDVCKGPVAIVEPRAKQPWIYRKLRRPKARRDLLRFVRGEKDESKRLGARRIRGAKKRRVLKRLRRKLKA